MEQYVVLLRGVNVGGNNIVPMKDLKQALENAGFNQVATYIQSGNVVLQSAEPPRQTIEALIASQFGFKPHVLVLSKPEFVQAAQQNPFANEEGKTTHLYFCEQRPAIDLDKIREVAAPTERFEQVGNVFYLLAPDGIGRSKLVAKMDHYLGVPTTGRNLNTVNKLLTMLRES